MHGQQNNKYCNLLLCHLILLKSGTKYLVFRYPKTREVIREFFFQLTTFRLVERGLQNSLFFQFKNKVCSTDL